MIYLTAFVEILKLINILVSSIIKMKAEEWEMWKIRFQTILDMIDKSIKKQQDAFNETAYLNNREWEFKKRYEVYKNTTINILKSGGGIAELSSSTNSGMGQQIIKIKDQIIAILNMPTTIEDKSVLVAKTLLEIQV